MEMCSIFTTVSGRVVCTPDVSNVGRFRMGKHDNDWFQPPAVSLPVLSVAFTIDIPRPMSSCSTRFPLGWSI